MNTRSSESESTDSLHDILSSLQTTAQVRPEIANYTKSLSKRLMNLTRDYYGSIVFLFTTPLSFHQRLVLMQLISIYPQGISGIDLARALGISVKSKSIYHDLKTLEKQGFIRLDEVHSRLKLAYANSDNSLINRLIELVQIHGDVLRDLLQREKEK
ncbi:MAG: hypothetical protein ACXAC8_14290 [Candidatus Hodarchaeales archaeon]